MKIRFNLTFSKVAILIVAAYLVIVLAASNRVAYSQSSTDIKQVENCLIERLLNRKCTVPPKPIILPTPTSSPTPTQP